jgi:hypothetical protein
MFGNLRREATTRIKLFKGWGATRGIHFLHTSGFYFVAIGPPTTDDPVPLHPVLP